MEKLIDGKYTFEVINYVPYGYVIWNIGKNMIDGYLPLVQVDGEYQVNTKTMKAIKIEGAQKILAVTTHGQNTIKKMETYIKRYENSKRKCTQRHVERLKEALEVMYLIDWRN
jgi:hypothetical protein